MHLIIGISIFLILTVAIMVQWKNRILNPLFLFTVFSLFFTICTIPLLDLRDAVDYTHALTLLVYSGSVLFYCLFFHSRSKSTQITAIWKSRSHVAMKNQTVVVCFWLLLISACFVTYYYLYLVGYNLMFQALMFGVDDFTTKRLAAYAGDSYTLAGVVNQFKNTILPLSFFSLCLYYSSSSQRMKIFLLLLLGVPFYLWAIIGTGQRTFLFFNLVVLYIYFYNRQKISKKVFVLFTVGFVWVFGFMSVWLSRSDAGFGGIVEQLMHRIFYSNQISSVEGFRYIYTLPIQYGVEWFEVVTGFIPGVRGSDLSNRVHGYIFSSYRGTSPVSLWVSIYHNFGLFGVPPVVLVVMYIIDKVRALLLKFPKNDFSIMFFSFLFFYIGIIPATNPFQILNNGLFGLIFVVLVLKGARLLVANPAR